MVNPALSNCLLFPVIEASKTFYPDNFLIYCYLIMKMDFSSKSFVLTKKDAFLIWPQQFTNQQSYMPNQEENQNF